MSVGGISGSGMNALYYSAEQNQAYIMEQNQLVPVSPEETQEILEEHDIKIKNGKAYSISEDYELSPADVAAALSAGGIPELPPTMQITGASKPESVGKAINRLADSSGISGLLFQQLMTLMKSARDDQELNEQLTLILQSGKIANMRGDLGALAAKQSAEKSAEQTSFVLQCIAQGAAAAASLLGAAGDNTKVQVAANMASTAQMGHLQAAAANQPSQHLGITHIRFPVRESAVNSRLITLHCNCQFRIQNPEFRIMPPFSL